MTSQLLECNMKDRQHRSIESVLNDAEDALSLEGVCVLVSLACSLAKTEDDKVTIRNWLNAQNYKEDGWFIFWMARLTASFLRFPDGVRVLTRVRRTALISFPVGHTGEPWVMLVSADHGLFDVSGSVDSVYAADNIQLLNTLVQVANDHDLWEDPTKSQHTVVQDWLRYEGWISDGWLTDEPRPKGESCLFPDND